MKLNLILLAISFAGILLFWLFYRRANNSKNLTEKYLIKQLKKQDLNTATRAKHEKQLSNILQQNSSQGSVKVIALFALLALPLSLYFYYKLGSPDAIDYVSAAKNNQSSSAQAPQMSMQDAIKQLQIRLEKNPNDIDGQVLYARSLISIKDYPNAVIAYRKANELSANEAIILTELAEAIALANNNRSFLGEPEQLLTQAVKLDANNQKALWLLGMTFYEHEDFAKTNELWTRLYSMMTDTGAKKQLLEQLNGIRNKLGIVDIQQQASPTIGNHKSALTIRINITDNLKQNLKDKRALLYVYSKETSGMPMPIAVVRQPLEQIEKRFPIEVQMNDGNSLQAHRKLSDFNKIKIGVRISFTGNATPQAGDLQGEELIIELPHKQVIELLIDKVR